MGGSTEIQVIPDWQRTDLLQRQRHTVLFLLYQERSATSLSWVQHYRRSIKTTTMIIIIIIIIIMVIITMLTIISYLFMYCTCPL